MTRTIDAHGDPLAFQCRPSERRPALLTGAAGADVFRVEAHQMEGHQKEAVVTEGAGGAAWRVTSDEGRHLKGTDLAPFPLGFFNAGLQGDLLRRVRELAAARAIRLDRVSIELENNYWLTGSFVLGTGEGHAEPTRIAVEIASPATAETIKALVHDAALASPALALLRTPLANTFALYVNGRRRDVQGVPSSSAGDCDDPYRVYASAPRPAGATRRNLIEKIDVSESGTPEPAPPATSTRIVRTVLGRGTMDDEGTTDLESWLRMPGASHFRFSSGEGGAGTAPSGLALLSAGIAFCYMTQLSRYIEHMKFPIHGVRLVQLTPFETAPAGAGLRGLAHAIDTHLFLNGEAPEAEHAKLLHIAARTCYLHATAAAALEPVIEVRHRVAVP